MTKLRKYWAGIVEGKIDHITVDAGWGGYGAGDMVSVPAIFRTKKAARAKYQKVCPVMIRAAQESK